MKLTILFLLISSLCFSQTLVDVSKIYFRKDITLSDGLIYKYQVVPNNDTARYFNSGNDVYEATIVFKKIGGIVVPPTPVTEKIDGELATFVGTWVRSSVNPGWHMNTIAFSNTPGATVSYTFTGTKVELWGEKLSSHGTGTISIDNGAAVTVSFVGTRELPALIYTSPTLANGTHVIKLTVGSGYNLLDYFTIYK